MGEGGGRSPFGLFGWLRDLQLVLLLLQIFPEMRTFGLPMLHLFLRHGMVSDAANEG